MKTLMLPKFILFYFVFLIFLLSTSTTYAEYRAYRLGVKYHPENQDDEEVQVITSLDNLQYETYYKITPNQQTRIISHWRCKGRTDYHTAYCEEPLKQTPDLNAKTPTLNLAQDPRLQQNSQTPQSNAPSESPDSGANTRSPASN